MHWIAYLNNQSQGFFSSTGSPANSILSVSCQGPAKADCWAKTRATDANQQIGSSHSVKNMYYGDDVLQWTYFPIFFHKPQSDDIRKIWLVSWNDGPGAALIMML